MTLGKKRKDKKSNAILYSSYSIISSLFNQFSLVIEHDKSEVFHFSRSTKKNRTLSTRPQVDQYSDPRKSGGT